MARPGRAQLGQDSEGPSQRIADYERLVGLERVERIGPKIDESERRRHRRRRAKGKETKGESDPLIGAGVKHVEGVMRRHVTVVVVVVVMMMMVRWTEGDQVERWLGGDKFHEGRRGQGLVEEFADRSTDNDLTEWKS